VHEILASVLLELHNTQWWMGYFGALRGAINNHSLGELIQWSQERRAAGSAVEEPAAETANQ
jgi:hypothetical protein